MPLRVAFTFSAARDLDRIESYIARESSAQRAERFIASIYKRCQRIALAPHQGTPLEGRRPGLRRTGFKRRVSIAFYVDESEVVVVSIAYAGRQHRKHL